MGCSCSNQIIDCKDTSDLLARIEELIDYIERIDIAPTEKQKSQMIHYDIDFSEQLVYYKKILPKNKSKALINQISLLNKHFHQLTIRWKYLTGKKFIDCI